MLTEKIIATIGPSSASVDVLEKMILEGVSCFRINFSHGDEKMWKEFINLIREAEERTGMIISIMGDLCGPSIRVGNLDKDILLNPGEEGYFVLKEKTSGDSREVPIPNKKFFEIISEGDTIIMDDGLIRLSIEEVSGNFAKFKAITSAHIKPRKSVVIFQKEVPLPSITERDMKALKSVVKTGEIDIVAASYVKSARDIDNLRDILKELGIEEIKIAAKIETRSAVQKLDEIVRASDYIIVARGDLGMHYPLEEIPNLQSRIVRTAIIMGKPVYVATQILASMVKSPIPTRSEIVDVVYAIKDGVDGFLVTGETAIGEYPVEVIRWLKKILNTYDVDAEAIRRNVSHELVKYALTQRDRFAEGVVNLSESLNAKLVVYTKSGGLAKRIAKFRPKTPFYAASSNLKILRQLSIIYGVIPVKVSSHEYSEGLDETFEKLKETGELCYGDTVVLTYGLIEEPTHLVKIVRVL